MNLKRILTKKVPDGWTKQTVNLGESTLLYLKPTKKQLEEIDPNSNLSITPYGTIPKKQPSTLSKILDNIDRMSADSKGNKYFDFDTNDLASFDSPKNGYDSADALNRNLNIGQSDIKPKKNKNK